MNHILIVLSSYHMNKCHLITSSWFPGIPYKRKNLVEQERIQIIQIVILFVFVSKILVYLYTALLMRSGWALGGSNTNCSTFLVGAWSNLTTPGPLVGIRSQFDWLWLCMPFSWWGFMTKLGILSCDIYFLGCQIALATGFLSLIAFGSKCLASVWEAETNAWLSKAMAAGITVPYDTLGLQTADLINNQWPLRSGILLKEVRDFKVFQLFLNLQGLQVTSRYRFRQCFLMLLLCGIGHLLSCDDSTQFQIGEYIHGSTWSNDCSENLSALPQWAWFHLSLAIEVNLVRRNSQSHPQNTEFMSHVALVQYRNGWASSWDNFITFALCTFNSLSCQCFHPLESN